MTFGNEPYEHTALLFSGYSHYEPYEHTIRLFSGYSHYEPYEHTVRLFSGMEKEGILRVISLKIYFFEYLILGFKNKIKW